LAPRGLDSLRLQGKPVTRIVFWPEAAITAPLADERAAAQAITLTERLRATRTLASGDLLLTGGLGLTASDKRQVDGATNMTSTRGV
jgi:hypothetical protein